MLKPFKPWQGFLSRRMRNIFIYILVCEAGFASFSALPQDSSKPNIIEEKHGNVTNYAVEGNLAAAKPVGCIPLADAKNDLTPADLYPGVLDCIEQNKFEMATDLFALAGIYARFDAERVTDETAGQAGQALIMNTFSDVPQNKKSQFLAVFNRVSKSAKSLGPLCVQIQKIGAPDYYPKYMILHGVKAFTGDPYEGALSDKFDPVAAWRRLQSDYLHCPTKEKD
jgi:hypothetical protein